MRRQRIAGLAVAVVCLLLTVPYTYYLMFSRFSWYDDEGYVMLTVRLLMQGHPLYDQVYTPYGPFYYLVRLLIQGMLDAPVSHDLTRLITIGTWIGVAALGAAFVWRTTWSVAAAVATYLLLVWHLGPLANEPGHPQEVAALLLALIVFSAGWVRAPAHAGTLATILGVLVGCLALTKINLGGFAVVSLGMVAATVHSGRARTAWLIGAALTGMALPWVLMRAHAAGWAFGYAGIVSLSVASVSLGSLAAATGRQMGVGPPRRFVAAMILTIALVCAATMALGTSVSGLVQGIILRPLELAGLFWTEVRVSPAPLIVGVVSVALAAAYALWPPVNRLHPGALQWVIWWLKVSGSGLALFVAIGSPHALLAFGSLVLWLTLARPLGGGWSYDTVMPRLVIVSVAALQTLQAYPVAESQVAFATFLVIPAMIVCLFDAIRDLLETPAFAAVAKAPLRTAAAATVTVALLVAAHQGLDVSRSRAVYAASVPLGLDGGRRIRLPAGDASRYQRLVSLVRARCGTLLTVPGLHSFYFWSGLEPPTPWNATLWPLLFSDEEQQRIVDRLSPRADGCVIEYAAGVRLGGRGERVWVGPLMRFAVEDFIVVEERDGFRFKVRLPFPRDVIGRAPGAGNHDSPENPAR